MLHKRVNLILVLFIILSAVLVSVSIGIRTALAGACSGSVSLERESAPHGEVIYFNWSVSCPNGLDTTKFFVDEVREGTDFQILETNKLTNGKDYIPTGRYSPGIHTLRMLIYGEGENRQNPTEITAQFTVLDQNGGVVPTSVPSVNGQTPVAPGQNVGPNKPDPAANEGECASLPTLVKPGDIAVINTITPDPARARRGASKSEPTVFLMPIGSPISIVSERVCSEGWTWFLISYNGQTGWAPHATSAGYEYVPNGYTLPYFPGMSPSQTQNCDSVLTPRLKPGDRGRVIDPEPEWVMDRASFLKPAQKLAELREGEQFTVISGPHCGSGKGGAVNFYEVQADNGIRGFVGEGYSSYWLEPIQAQQPTQEPAQTDDVCIDGDDPQGSFRDIMVGNSPPQCTDLIRQQYPQLAQLCPSVRGNAGLWDDKVRSKQDRDCPLTINPPIPQSQGGLIGWKDIRPGDIAIWDANCGEGKDKAGDVGHVAIVGNVLLDPPDYPNTTGPVRGWVLVWEWNWGNNRYPHSHQIWSTCMSFIHVPWAMSQVP